MKIRATLTPVDVIDLEGLVRRLREATFKRSQVPKHSGSATKDDRKRNRLRRRQLKEEIEAVQKEIVQWAQARFPMSDQQIEALYDIGKKDSKEVNPAESNVASGSEGLDLSDAGGNENEGTVSEGS